MSVLSGSASRNRPIDAASVSGGGEALREVRRHGDYLQKLLTKLLTPEGHKNLVLTDTSLLCFSTGEGEFTRSFGCFLPDEMKLQPN